MLQSMLPAMVQSMLRTIIIKKGDSLQPFLLKNRVSASSLATSPPGCHRCLHGTCGGTNPSYQEGHRPSYQAGHRPWPLVCIHVGRCRQMKLRCQYHTGCLASRPRQMKLRWRAHPSLPPSLRLLGLRPPHPPGRCHLLALPHITPPTGVVTC